MSRVPSSGFFRIAALLLASLAGVGCGTVKQTGTARTGTEQILLTNAWDDALRKVDFRPLAGVPVYLDTQFVTAVDQGWVVSSLRQAMISQGVLLRAKPEQAQWIVEARVGAYGTDSYNYLIGVPQVTVPPTLAGVPTGTIPEIPLMKKSQQLAFTKMALFAYDRTSGQMVWRSGTQLTSADAKDVYVGGFGPISSGSIRKKNRRIGINLPMISDPTPTIGPAGQPAATGLSDPAATMPLPASASDLESFSP
jgi:hypothetical protein